MSCMAKSRKRSQPDPSAPSSAAPSQSAEDTSASARSTVSSQPSQAQVSQSSQSRQASQSTQSTPAQRPPSSTRAPADSGASEDYRERVAQRAYELYQSRGGAHGSDWEDWLAAERELIANRGNQERSKG
jgi:hypothetical protein